MPWHNKNTYGYLRSSTEAQDNATMCMNILSTLGWSKTAVCCALGNFEIESGYNPWRWQSETILPVGDSRIGVVCGGNTAHAYGIFQSDPAANYIYRPQAQGYIGYAPNYSNQVGGQNDGTAQMHYLNWVCTNYSDGSCGGWNESYHDAIPFIQFKTEQDTSNGTINHMTKVFHDGYERSATWYSTGSDRMAAARYWRDYFAGYTPPTPDDGAVWYGVFKMLQKKKQQGIYYRKRHKGWWF